MFEGQLDLRKEKYTITNSARYAHTAHMAKGSKIKVLVPMAHR